MRRLQLMEIHEQPWCPAAIRDGATAVLDVVATVGRQYVRVGPLLRRALAATGARRVVDLGSGGGGPWRSLYHYARDAAGFPIPVLLTDLYPNTPAMVAAAHHSRYQLQFSTRPVEASQVPEAFDGLRTLFTAFHHFPPDAARAVLQDAVDRRQPIGIFEQTQRSWLGLLVMLVMPWLALLAVPLTRPLGPARLFWTYVVPAVPLVLWIDGMVSCLRTYRPEEIAALAEGLDEPSYHWEFGRLRSPLSPLGVTYAIGYPCEEGAPDEPNAGEVARVHPTSPRVARTT